jgi:hypothetical protein
MVLSILRTAEAPMRLAGKGVARRVLDGPDAWWELADQS